MGEGSGQTADVSGNRGTDPPATGHNRFCYLKFRQLGIHPLES